MKRVPSFLVIVLAASLATADDTSQAQSNYEHLKALEWLVGEWEADYELPDGVPELGSAGDKIHSRVTFRWFQGKNYLVFTGTDTANGKVIITGRETTAWDAESGKLVHTIFQSTGFHGTGEWSGSGDEWDLKWSVRGPDNSVYAGTSKHKRVDDNIHIWHMTDLTHNGEEIPDWPAVTYRRVTNAGSDAIPEKAIAALKFFVGSWKSETFLNGNSIGTRGGNRTWLQGRHAILMQSVRTADSKGVHASGISGWDAKGKQIVEHWHASDGLSVTVRYPLADMKEDVWTGNFSATFNDGQQFDGDCVLQKTATGFEWTAKWVENGAKMVRKSITQRVK